MRWTMSSFAFAGARLSRPLPSPVVAFSSLSGVLCVRSVPMGTSDRKVRDGDAQERDAAAGHRVGRHQSVEGEMVPRMVPGTPEERGFFTNAEFAMP